MQEWIEFTREQLYDLGWDKPMSRLAAEFSISDVGLAKLCDRHQIPTPPRGYWARREAGEKVRRPPLPATNDTSPIHLLKKEPRDENPEAQGALAASIAAEKSPENKITVADRLRSPSALVQKARELLLNAKPDQVGLLECPADCLYVNASQAQLPRALRILDALVRAFEDRGWDTAARDGRTFVEVDNIQVSFSIQEGLVSEERPPKPDLGGSYSFHYNRHETVRRPSGSLSVSIRETTHLWDHAQQRNWHDADKRALEERLNDVVIGVLKLVAATKVALARKEREAREEAERRRKLEEALEEQRKLTAELVAERAKVKRLLRQAVAWRRSQNLRQYVEHMRQEGRVPESELGGQGLEDWAQWALQQADRLDPFKPSPHSIIDDAERIEHMCDGLRRY